METILPKGSSLVPQLQKVLQNLLTHPYTEIHSPEDDTKRASVALIIRISPSYEHSYTAAKNTLRPNAPVSEELGHFFSHNWVRHGEPELLFIQRASRHGDPWSGDVAFPGGGRDIEDDDDLAAAVRETAEEVGLDLSVGSGNAIQVGTLPQRFFEMRRVSPSPVSQAIC